MKKTSKVVPLVPSDGGFDLAAARTRKPAPTTEGASLQTRMEREYRVHLVGTMGFTKDYALDSVRVIRVFTKFSGAYAWEWTPLLLDQFNEHLRESKRLAHSTHRKYQTSIRLFHTWAAKMEEYQVLVRELTGCEFRPVLENGDGLRNSCEREVREPRPYFTPQQVEKLFATLDKQIAKELKRPGRELLLLYRDRAIFKLLLATGLRASSVLALKIYSFEANPQAPALGNFGFYSTTGKGSKGSGPKPIKNPVDDVELPPTLEWYLNNVRPHFVKDEKETALFLSERGTALTYPSLWSRLNRLIKAAGLGGQGLSPHGARHSKASEMAMVYGLQGAQRMLNHVYASTTQNYTQVPEEYVQRKVRQQIDFQLGRKPKDD